MAAMIDWFFSLPDRGLGGVVAFFTISYWTFIALLFGCIAIIDHLL